MQLNATDKSVELYRQVLAYDSSNVEAIACLASNYFYTDQPELALRFYRRLLQMGMATAELWSNLGLCCFYASQYDMCLTCYERALSMADDTNNSDIWYNVGQLAIGIGDLGLVRTCTQCAVHTEAQSTPAARTNTGSCDCDADAVQLCANLRAAPCVCHRRTRLSRSR